MNRIADDSCRTCDISSLIFCSSTACITSPAPAARPSAAQSPPTAAHTHGHTAHRPLPRAKLMSLTRFPQMDIPEDSAARLQLVHSLHDTFVRGDLDDLAKALGPSPRWYDELLPMELHLGHPLNLAI